MADALDVTVAYFDREVRRHARAEHVRQDGRRLMFYCRGVLDAWYGSRAAAAAPSVDLGPVEGTWDLLLSSDA